MDNLLRRLKTWVQDPFGQKREREENQLIINRMIATKTLIREMAKQQEQSFPISNMVNYHNELRKD